MQLAIGDVVRDRNSDLGVVTGFADEPAGLQVVVQFSGGELRSVWAYNVQVVARAAKALSSGRAFALLAVGILSCIATYIGIAAEAKLGAGPLMLLLTGSGAGTFVMAAGRLVLRMFEPRRTRI